MNRKTWEKDFIKTENSDDLEPVYHFFPSCWAEAGSSCPIPGRDRGSDCFSAHHHVMSQLYREEIYTATTSHVTSLSMLCNKGFCIRPGSWHRKKQFHRSWFATALPCVIYLFHVGSCGALSPPPYSSPLGSNINNRWSYFYFKLIRYLLHMGSLQQ